VRKLPGYFELNAVGTALVARRGGHRYRLGDPIEVRVSDIDRPAGKIELTLA
jgi:exoribonuclease R